MTRYDVKAILESNTLPIGGGAAKRLKEAQALETSRKREEMLALNSSSFQYGTSSSSNTRLQPYPLMQYHHQFEQPQPLLTLQNNHESLNSQQFSQHQGGGYFQTQLELCQQQNQQPSQNSNIGSFYNGYYQNHPGLFQMNNIGSSSSSSVMGNNGGGSSGIYSNSGGLISNNAVEEFVPVKVDYDMQGDGSGFGGWSAAGENMQTADLFTMWNDYETREN